MQWATRDGGTADSRTVAIVVTNTRPKAGALQN